MDESSRFEIRISYDEDRLLGTLSIEQPTASGLWDRLCQSAASLSDDCRLAPDSICVPWPTVLSLIRIFAPNQRKWDFRLRPDDTARGPVEDFLSQYKSAREARAKPQKSLSEAEVSEKLEALGFTRRRLKDFQIRDLQRLLSLPNGANFSVPGAGKTTVTFALHLLTRSEGQQILVVGPKSSFPAWSAVVNECVADDAPDWVREPFSVLSGGAAAVHKEINSAATRYIINYDQLIVLPDIFSNYLAQNAVHLVLDESHRMKGGLAVKRGVVLLNAATLPIRRDILSGTPMPQGPQDLQSQLDFLWPGAGFGYQIAKGTAPRQLIGNLYVRTTKADLRLPPVRRHFIQVGMGKGQSALYAIVRNETLRHFSRLRSGSGVDIVRARRSVMRLLQLSANPVLALRSILQDAPTIESGVVQQILDDGPSPKMVAVRDLARDLASQGRKVVVWSIFTDTINQMERMLADLNPVVVYGATPTGDSSDTDTREGKIRQFHEDANCMAFISNPAAAGEGINLHHVCHDAVYLDRSYNTTHYLQSVDRIHRLGLAPDTPTNVYIVQTKVPKSLGCIDHAVSRRLATKLRALQQLLDDEDLHQIALDEEDADEPIDYGVDPQDLMDLIEELEGTATFDEDECV